LECSGPERDELLEKFIARLEGWVEHAKSLKGSVVVPTYKEWQVADFLYEQAIYDYRGFEEAMDNIRDYDRHDPATRARIQVDFKAQINAVWERFDAQLAKINDAVERRASGQPTAEYDEWLAAEAQGREDFIEERERKRAERHKLYDERRMTPEEMAQFAAVPAGAR
jgi:hypothetical protein